MFLLLCNADCQRRYSYSWLQPRKSKVRFSQRTVTVELLIQIVFKGTSVGLLLGVTGNSTHVIQTKDDPCIRALYLHTAPNRPKPSQLNHINIWHQMEKPQLFDDRLESCKSLFPFKDSTWTFFCLCFACRMTMMIRKLVWTKFRYLFTAHH